MHTQTQSFLGSRAISQSNAGPDVESIFASTTGHSAPPPPANMPGTGFVPTGWSQRPLGTNSLKQYEWIATRSKTNNGWSAFSSPVLWAQFSNSTADSGDREYIFQRTVGLAAPSTPVTAQMKKFLPVGWADDPVGINSLFPFEWTATRSKTGTVWSAFSTPVLWAKLAAAGGDSADVEYIYQRTVSADAPGTPPTAQLKDFVPGGWTDDPIGVDSVYQFEWSVFREKTDTGWSAFSNAVLWKKFREN